MQNIFDCNRHYCLYESTIVSKPCLLISKCHQDRFHWQSRSKDPQFRFCTKEACEGEILGVTNPKVMLPLFIKYTIIYTSLKAN